MRAELLIGDGWVAAHMVGRGVWVRDQESGELLSRMPMAGIEILARLSEDLALAGPYRRVHRIVTLPDLGIVAELPLETPAGPPRTRYLPVEAELVRGPDRTRLRLTGFCSGPDQVDRVDEHGETRWETREFEVDLGAAER